MLGKLKKGLSIEKYNCVEKKIIQRIVADKIQELVKKKPMTTIKEMALVAYYDNIGQDGVANVDTNTISVALIESPFAEAFHKFLSEGMNDHNKLFKLVNKTERVE